MHVSWRAAIPTLTQRSSLVIIAVFFRTTYILKVHTSSRDTKKVTAIQFKSMPLFTFLFVRWLIFKAQTFQQKKTYEAGVTSASTKPDHKNTTNCCPCIRILLSTMRRGSAEQQSWYSWDSSLSQEMPEKHWIQS